PLLVIMFIILVVRALMLPGALGGLDAFFRPNWEALLSPPVWVAAYGQIFFSLSVAFGIKLTYASYLKKNTDLTGSGLVVGFANSGFEMLAGIVVFSALWFMSRAQGVALDGEVESGIGLAFIAFASLCFMPTSYGVALYEVFSSAIGLAFIAFPALIADAPGGAVIGVLFFGSLVLAGSTSLISIVEVIIAAIQDKLRMGRIAATLAVTVPLAVFSTIIFPTTMGMAVLDVFDNWVNQYGIVAAALISTVVVAYLVRG